MLLLALCLDVLAEAKTTVLHSEISSARRPTRRNAGPLGWTYSLVRLDERYRRDLKAVAAARGTHASPRWHMRIGHERHLPSGKVVWVRPAEVGKRELGGIVHDYLT